LPGLENTWAEEVSSAFFVCPAAKFEIVLSDRACYFDRFSKIRTIAERRILLGGEYYLGPIVLTLSARLL
jgi:hypothetical protein